MINCLIADIVGFTDWFSENECRAEPIIEKFHKAQIEYANDTLCPKKTNTSKPNNKHNPSREKWNRNGGRTEQWNCRMLLIKKDMKSFYAQLKAIYNPQSRGNSPLFGNSGENIITNPDEILDRSAKDFQQL